MSIHPSIKVSLASLVSMCCHETLIIFSLKEFGYTTDRGGWVPLGYEVSYTSMTYGSSSGGGGGGGCEGGSSGGGCGGGSCGGGGCGGGCGGCGGKLYITIDSSKQRQLIWISSRLLNRHTFQENFGPNLPSNQLSSPTDLHVCI